MRCAVLVLAVLFAVPAGFVGAEEEPLPDPPVILSASREDVWKAWTTPEGLASWRGGRAVIDLRVGGELRWHERADAATDDPGWTTQRVLAFAPPRLLVLGDVRSDTQTMVELEALDSLRTAIRIEHVSLPDGQRAAAKAADANVVVRLVRRFPARADPVVEAFARLAGTWEERDDANAPLRGTWTFVLFRNDDVLFRQRPSPCARIEHRVVGSDEVERWTFWRESRSGRWVGALVGEYGAIEWDIDPYVSGGIGWGDPNAVPGGRWYSIEGAPSGDAVTITEGDGCCGHPRHWTRVKATK